MSIILVYQMGKVGSKTVVDSLVGTGFKRIDHQAEKRLQQAIEQGQNIVVHCHAHESTRSILDYCRTREMLNQVRVISLVREILPRNMSSFFQNFDKPGKRNWYFGPKKKIQHTSIKRLSIFFRKCNLRYVEKRICNWPQKFSDATGFQMLDHAFDTARGFSSYETDDGLRLYFCQTEMLTARWDSLRDYLELDTLPMIPSNVGDDKWYADIYARFKEAYVASDRELTACYDNDIMDHFYSESDLDRFRERWSGRNTDRASAA